ncbi:MAG TPA: glutathione transferase GstA [Gallionellaceae bacterium]
MKLYYSPGACSLSPHIVLAESGLSFDVEKVDFSAMKTERGVDFAKINPKGYVPVIALDNGQMLTEGSAIVQYIADQVPQKKLAPPAGTMERYRLMEWLNFIATELHKGGFSPLFNPDLPDELRAKATERLSKRIGIAAAQLGKTRFLMGDTFTVADAYLFTMLRWAPRVKLDLASWPVLKSYQERIEARPAVYETLLGEGLIESRLAA